LKYKKEEFSNDQYQNYQVGLHESDSNPKSSIYMCIFKWSLLHHLSISKINGREINLFF